MASILPQKLAATFSTNRQGKHRSKCYTLIRDVCKSASCEIFITQIAYECSLKLRTLTQAFDNTSLIKVKPLKLCLPWPLMLKVVASFCGKIKAIAFTLFCCQLESALSIDSSYSTLKVVIKPYDLKQNKLIL